MQASASLRRGTTQCLEAGVRQVLQVGHGSQTLTLACREGVGPQPIKGAPIPGDRESLDEPELDQHPGSGADPTTTGRQRSRQFL